MKQLAKVHKDKAELDRMKREVAKTTVEKGVNECTRLTEIYDKRRGELERQHEEIRQRLDEERNKVRIILRRISKILGSKQRQMCWVVM